MDDLTKPKEAWGSRIGVIMAVTGSAVGLGNFLRFPGKAAQYEGGAFMVPYFIALLLLGLPIAWAEWSIGRYGGSKGYNSLPGIFRAVWRKNPLAPYLGAFAVLIPVAIYMYYVYIEAWCLGYAIRFLTGEMAMGTQAAPYEATFNDFVGIKGDGEAFHFAGGFFHSALFYLLICFALNFILIYRGLSKGIEWFCRWAMPALIICAVIVLVRVLTLGTPNPEHPDRSVNNGLGYMWNPTVEATWLAPADKGLKGLIAEYEKGWNVNPPAATPDAPMPPMPTAEQIAEKGWSPARGNLLTAAIAESGWRSRGDGEYANQDSRLVLKVNTTDAGTLVTVRNKTFWESLLNAKMWLEAAGQIFFSLSIGFGIIACYASYLKKNDDIALSSLTSAAGNEFCEVALGGLITIPAAFVFLGAAGTVGGTFGLGFNTLPMVFASMPMGQFIGFIFFILLFLAAVTSSLSMLQPAIALFEEGLGVERKASVAMLGIITAIGAGFVVFFSKDLMALDTIDFWIGSFSLYVLATIEVFLFGWVMGVDKGYEELNRGAEIRVPKFIMFIIKFVSPVFLLVVFAAWTWQSAGGYIKGVTSNLAAGLSVGFMGVLLVFFIILVARSVKRWQANEAAAAKEVHL